MQRLAPWPVTWVDPAPAIARRVIGLIGAATESAATARAIASFTSGAAPDAALATALAQYGLALTGD